jgi:hypothetical protein
MGEKKYAYRILAGKTEGRRLKRRWDSRINLDLKDMGYEGVDWINLALDKDK